MCGSILVQLMLNALHAYVDAFHQLAIGGNQVRQEPHHQHDRTQDQTQGREHHGLHMARACADDHEVQVAQARQKTQRKQDRAGPEEQQEWPVDGEYAQDRYQRALYIAADALDQPRRPQIRIGKARPPSG